MAGLKETLNKGIATLNLKTSNFMDETKYKTEITTKEKEIVNLKVEIGTIVYESRNQFSISLVEEKLSSIYEKEQAIEDLKRKIIELSERERSILGTSQGSQGNTGSSGADSVKPDASRLFCSRCGAENKVGYKFCEKCGFSLGKG